VLYMKNTGTASAPVYVQVTGTTNPLNSVGSTYKVALVDLDADGDLDFVNSTNSSTLDYYKNIGTSTAANFSIVTGSSNPVDGITAGSPVPEFADLDNDGDKDLLVAISDGTFAYYKNTGSASAAVFTLQTGTTLDPFAAVTGGNFQYASLEDVDGDLDLDLTIGTGTEGFFYYRNTGTTSAPAFTARTGTNNPFDAIPVSYSQYYGPDYMDVDGDGDMDLFVAKHDGTVDLYENLRLNNTTGIFAPTTASFNGTINAFPNPVKDVLNFTLSDGIGSTIGVSVLNMEGTTLLNDSFENTGSAESINVSSLNNGIYMLKLNAENKTSVVRFIKQ
jgi:hypothetical protein